MKIDSIENPILNQDFALARKQIKKYLHRSRFSDESKLYAAIYYRWMGEFSRALKLLAKYIHPKALEKTPILTLKLHMEAARCLTYLGAESTGLSITRRMNSVRPRKTAEQSAYLFYWSGFFEEALPFFESTNDASDPLDYYTRNIYAGLCHSHLHRFETASRYYEKVLAESDEPSIIATTRTALATHWIAKKN